MRFTSETHLEPDLLEREFTVADVHGILWTPRDASAAQPVPLILMGQPGGFGMRRMRPRLEARARSAAALGFAAVAIEPPGVGDRPPLAGSEQARDDLRRAIAAGERPDDDVLLQWDDEGDDRQMALDLFDAFASTEKTLYANMGGHTGIPPFAGDDAARFFARHLGSTGT